MLLTFYTESLFRAFDVSSGVFELLNGPALVVKKIQNYVLGNTFVLYGHLPPRDGCENPVKGLHKNATKDFKIVTR